MNNDLSIIIVNYNSHADIDRCIESINLTIRNIICEIIVVDNNSPDRGILSLRSKFNGVKLFFLDSNYGFGTACNYGAKKANGKYLVFVNPDTIFTDNCLMHIYDFLENTIDAAACSPSFVNPDGSSGYVFNYFPDIAWELYDFLGKGYNLRINKLNKILISAADLEKPLKVDWTTAACLMVRKETFDKVKGFDEDYFLYYEDIDIQKRFCDIGYNIYCLPYLKVVHLTNTSTKQDNDDSVYYYNINKSRLIYHRKHSGILKRSFVKLIHLFGFILRLLILNFRSRYSEMKNIKRLQYKKLIKYYTTGIE